MTDELDRRTFVRTAAGIVVTGSVAGCAGGDDGGEMDDGMTATDAMDGGMSETDAMSDGMSEADGMGDGMGETDEETDVMSETDDGMMSATTFEVTVTNVSEPGTLTTSDGDDLAVPLSPTAYAVHTDDAAAFQEGESAGDALESLAEDGSPDGLASAVEMVDGVESTGTAATPDGADEHAPLAPGDSYTFEVEAGRDHNLTLATMFVQSNDLFYAPEPSGIPLFDGDEPIEGDLTDHLLLWDAGTEQNQEPGAGPDQAPRQDSPDTGPDEMGSVRRVENATGEYDYPDTSEVIEVTVTTM